MCAILNDTTGCLMSCAWKDSKCRIGLIIGTGTNACYLEDIDNVELWDGDSGDPRHVIINTEWGGFGDNGELDFIRTKWDLSVDEGSLNPGAQIFEKMISGMYMGELVRQVSGMNNIQGVFLHWASPKKLKCGKPRLDVSTLT